MVIVGQKRKDGGIWIICSWSGEEPPPTRACIEIEENVNVVVGGGGNGGHDRISKRFCLPGKINCKLIRSHIE